MNQAALTKRTVDVSNITWDDVFDKLEYDKVQKTFTVIAPKVKPEEILNETSEVILHKGSMNTMISEGSYIPWAMRPLAEHMKVSYGMREFHQYVSLSGGSSTFGRHNDNVNVMIVPIIGDIGYLVDGLGEVIMEPGDVLYIPKYVYHEPLIFGPRATLSFS
jgi:hypothetical protein|tara:strand:- start:1480 stop:1965 length:486 start_codon:yes stop_codon:yes gene_type:complete